MQSAFTLVCYYLAMNKHQVFWLSHLGVVLSLFVLPIFVLGIDNTNTALKVSFLLLNIVLILGSVIAGIISLGRIAKHRTKATGSELLGLLFLLWPLQILLYVVLIVGQKRT